MANLTLTIDDDALQRARERALAEGTSVNAVVRGYLERYARHDRERAALTALAELSDRSMASSGSEGRTWTRDGLYDR